MTLRRALAGLGLALSLVVGLAGPASAATVQVVSASFTWCDSSNTCARLKVWLENNSGTYDYRTTWQLYCFVPGGPTQPCRAITNNVGALFEWFDNGTGTTRWQGGGPTCTSSCPLGAGGKNQVSGPWIRATGSPPPYPSGVLEQSSAQGWVCPRTGAECVAWDVFQATTSKYRIVP